MGDFDAIFWYKQKSVLVCRITPTGIETPNFKKSWSSDQIFFPIQIVFDKCLFTTFLENFNEFQIFVRNVTTAIVFTKCPRTLRVLGPSDFTGHYLDLCKNYYSHSYSVSHKFLDDFVRLFWGHWVTNLLMASNILAQKGHGQRNN